MFKVLLVGLFLLHGAIHVMGFVKSRGPIATQSAESTSGDVLARTVPRPDGRFALHSLGGVERAWGVLWLVAAVLLALTGVLRLVEVRWWWALAVVAVALSQILIVAFWQDAKWGSVLNVVLLLAAVVGLGAWTFDSETKELERQLDESAAVEAAPDGRAADDALPTPVRRYLEKVLPEGAPVVRRVFVGQTGSFNVGAKEANWKAFEATHRVTTEPPGFVWAARVGFAPGLAVFVHDAYVGRRGTLAPWMAGLIPLGQVTDEGGETARGELLRFLAETPWYPTVLGGDGRISWSAVDERHARAVLRDGGVTATVLFTFGENDLVASIRAEDRPRLVDGKMVPTPWVGHWSDYEERAGYLIPTRCEVEWMKEEGPYPYFRGRVGEYRVE